MLTYKAMYKELEAGVHAEVLDFPGVITWGHDLEEARCQGYVETVSSFRKKSNICEASMRLNETVPKVMTSPTLTRAGFLALSRLPLTSVPLLEPVSTRDVFSGVPVK